MVYTAPVGETINGVTASGAHVVMGVIRNVGAPTKIDFVLSLRRILLDGSSGVGVAVFDAAGREEDPAYSIDGRLAYRGGDYLHGNAGIWIDGSRVLSCVVGQSGPGCAEGMSWSADGLSLLVWAGASISRVVLANHAMTPMTGAAGNHLGSATESPDVLSLVYSAYSTGGELWIADADGSNPRRLTSGDDSDPVWSPDSKWVLFSRTQVGGSGHFLISRSGREEIPITVGWVVYARIR